MVDKPKNKGGRPRTRPIVPKKPVGNPEIAKAGAKTQFKPGHKETKKRKIHGTHLRANLNYLLLQPIHIDPENLAESASKAMHKLAHDGQGNTHPARIAAARVIEKLIAKAEPAMLHEIITQTEGNLPQKFQQLDENEKPINVNKIVSDALVRSREKELEEEF